MPIQRKSVALCIVFSVLTCGLYALYWLYSLAEDVNSVTGRTDALSGGGVLLFSILTCGIYELFWLYQCGEAMDRLREEQGRASGHQGILYLLLDLFRLGIISYALLQSELNEYAA